MTPKNQPANYETFNHNNHHLPPSLDFTSPSKIPTNSTQSDTLQVKSPFLVKQTD
jgi:hypothetical protein